ncbi:MAG TPA: oxygen-independent coproporphyrinogen III oxidase [Xanthobacteraceae bacterium]
MSDQARALAELSVPRYTSYPTAPHFSPAVGGNDYACWLSSLSRSSTLSFYVHVPFCARLCHYCGCHTKAVRQRAPIETYAEKLTGEIALVARQLGGGKVVHLHWGGGTPSILGERRLAELFGRVCERFEVAASFEHAIELDPRYVTDELARVLAGIGVSRASLGAQDFNPAVQQAIGRVQPFETVREAVLRLREAGIERINLDLMYGLPGQTVGDVRRSAALAVSLAPQRLAYFGYAHVPWLKTHQRLIDASRLPGAAERLRQAEAAREVLVGLGYEHIGLDHFAQADDELAAAARSGRLHRNFQGYTTDAAEALIGFGASAIGRLAGGFVQNAPDVAGYARAISAGRLATVRGLVLSEDDRVRGAVIERLMCDFAVDLAHFSAAGRISGAFAAELAALAPLEAEGLVRLEGRRVAVTEQGRPFVRLVAAAFDAHLAQGRARHSIAV